MAEDRSRVAGENAYSVLGVHQDADDADIASAYRALARVYHPDIAGDGANARMSSINAAWDRLRTPRRRDAYDRELGIFPVRRAPRRSEPKRTSRASGADQPIQGCARGGRSPPKARRDGWRRTATRPAVRQRVAVRAPYRLVDRRGRPCRSGIPGMARGASGRRRVPRRDRRGIGEVRVPAVPSPPDPPAAAPWEAPLPARLIPAADGRRQPATAGTMTARSTRTW